MESRFRKFVKRVGSKKSFFSALIMTYLFLPKSSYSKLTGGGIIAPIIDQINEWRADLFVAGCVLIVLGITIALISNFMDTNFGNIINKVITGMILVAIITFIPTAIEMAGGATLNSKTIESVGVYL